MTGSEPETKTEKKAECGGLHLLTGFWAAWSYRKACFQLALQRSLCMAPVAPLHGPCFWPTQKQSFGAIYIHSSKSFDLDDPGQSFGVAGFCMLSSQTET